MSGHARREETPDVLEWLFVGLSFVLAGIHLYIALPAPAIPVRSTAPFLVIGALFLVVPVAFFTSWWHPLLYLLQALLTCSLGVLWALDGLENAPVGVLTGVPALLVILLAVYLFVREEPSSPDS